MSQTFDKVLDFLNSPVPDVSHLSVVEYENESGWMKIYFDGTPEKNIKSIEAGIWYDGSDECLNTGVPNDVAFRLPADTDFEISDLW